MTNIAEITETIRELEAYAHKELPTGDPWLDELYNGPKKYIPAQLYYKFLWLLAKMQGMKFGVELGTWRGFAASHMCAAVPESTVVTIDIHREDKEAQRYVQETIVPHFGGRLVYLNAWTWDAAPAVKAFNKPIDLLFIDAWHTYEYVQREWDLYTPLMAKKSLIVLDDLFNSDGTTIGM